MIETKITGSFLVTRTVAPRMLAAGSGRIVVISMNEQTMTRRGFMDSPLEQRASSTLPRAN